MRRGLLSGPAGSINAPTTEKYQTSQQADSKLSAPAAVVRGSTRLLCLDAVRGLNVMLMILVDNIGGCCFKEWVHHSPWDVVHLADFVMPLFLFMVGVSMAFSMQKYSGPVRPSSAPLLPATPVHRRSLLIGVRVIVVVDDVVVVCLLLGWGGGGGACRT
jgi:predicted acyltransferase